MLHNSRTLEGVSIESTVRYLYRSYREEELEDKFQDERHTLNLEVDQIRAKMKFEVSSHASNTIPVTVYVYLTYYTLSLYIVGREFFSSVGG